MKRDYTAARVQSSMAAVFAAEAFVADARRLATQWHIWVDGDSVVSAVLVRGAWQAGPSLEVEDTHSVGTILSGVDRLLRLHKVARLGIIMHIADECASAHIQERFASPESWETARRTIIDAPAEVIDERVPAGAAFRMVPFPATKSAGSVRLSSREKVFEALAADRRIILCVSSAPLELLAVSLPFLTPDEVREGGMVLLVYARFTVLATVREGTRELFGLAVLPHNKGVPAGIGTRLATEMKAHGIGRVNVYLVEAGSDVRRAIQATIAELQALGDQQRGLVDALALHGVARSDPGVFGSAESQDTIFARCAAECSTPPVELFRPEMLCGMLKGMVSPDVGGQNFSAAALKAMASAITRTEAVLFQATRALRVACITALVCCATALGIHIFNVLQAPFWNLDPKTAAAAEARLQRLSAINAAVSWWDKMLSPRSSSWVNLEFLSQLFPEGASSAVVSSVNYELLPQQPVRKPGDNQAPTSIGFVQRWSIKGLSNGGNITKTKVEEALEKTASITGQSLYTKGVTQRLNVAATAERTTPTKVRGVSYDSNFTLSVEIEVLPSDAAAIPVGKVIIPAAEQLVAK
jgi:hypothetical protein